MVSSLALRAQIASVVDALSRAAAAEIAKVVEDGVAVLRLEMCRRDNEIQTLRGNVEALHAELRAERDRLTLRPDSRGRDGNQSGSGGEGTLPDNVPEVQVKAAPLEPGQEEAGGRPHQPGGEAAHQEGSGGRWGPAAQNEAVRLDADYMRLGQRSLPCLPGSPLDGLGRGLPGHGQHRNLSHAGRRRTAKRLLFRKGFVCPYCGKVFEHAGHLERHKRIHTGEKPYRCEICGRRFNQKCSMKEHTKIHRRCFQPRLAEVQVQVQVQGEQKPTPEAKPCADGHWPEEGGQTYGEDGVPKNEDAPPAALVQVKSEPTEESVTQPGPLHGENGRTGEGAHGLGENFPVFGRDGQQWVSRPHGQSGAETSGRELLGGSAQSTTSLAGIAALLPAPVEASCSAFSFPGKPYSELKSSSQAPYGPPDTLLMPGEAGVCGLAEAPPNHHRQQRGRSLQAIRPKKCFVCSYCGKVFERAGHLERHLRIHTGEKPYGCHVCGRCFNQKSSLKGHMKTHRNGEEADVLEPHHLIFTMPDNQPLESQVGPAAFEEPLPGSEAVGEQVAAVVVVKLEPNGEGFQPGPDNDTGAMDWSHLWTPGTEKGGGSVGSAGQTVCSLPGDVMYRISPAAGAAYEQQGYMAPVKDPPFPDDNEMEDTMPDEQYVMMGPQSGSPGVTLALGPRDGRMVQEAALRDYGAAGDGTAFDFNMSASGDREENCGGNAAGPSSFICSSCGQSLNSFSLFQQHKCKTMTDQT